MIPRLSTITPLLEIGLNDPPAWVVQRMFTNAACATVFRFSIVWVFASTDGLSMVIGNPGVLAVDVLVAATSIAVCFCTGSAVCTCASTFACGEVVAAFVAVVILVATTVEEAVGAGGFTTTVLGVVPVIKWMNKLRLNIKL